MTSEASKFSCGACGRSYTWKKELAGRRGKCKCGQMMDIPASVAPPAPPEPQEDDLYSLADMVGMEKAAAANAAPTIIDANQFAMAAAAAAPTPRTYASGIPLAYQRGPSAREKARDKTTTTVDPVRDYYAPSALLLVGVGLYVGFYGFRYGLSAGRIVSAGIGLTIISAMETVILVGFAFMAAGPLGVSFGSVGPAILKLAAIAVFCDGVTTIVNGIVDKLAPGFGNGFFGFGIVGLPVAAGVYWSTLIYFFGMDPGDSWMVVAVLCVVYRIIRTLLMILLLEMLFNGMGLGQLANSIPASSAPGVMSAPPGSTAAAQIDEMDLAKEHHQLDDATEFVTKRAMRVEAVPVAAWHAAGAPNVWFQVVRDINANATPIRMVVELPKDKNGRAQCYAAAKAYYDGNKQFYDPADLQDTGDPYLYVALPR